MTKIISFQGELGAYSHQACRSSRKNWAYLPCNTFEDAIQAVNDELVDQVMLPVENSIYGRVADIHRLLPNSGLFIIDEVFERINIQALMVPGAKKEDLKLAYSHPVLIGQCQNFLRANNIAPVNFVDTAGSARLIAEEGDVSKIALASKLAGKLYKLETLQADVEDENYNRTRFVIMSREFNPTRRSKNMMTSFVFSVRNIPAALYKALGGFATTGVNMVKLESYMVGGSFNATQFFAEIEGHIDDRAVELALDELKFFCSYFKIIGVYPAHKSRLGNL